MVFEGTDHFKTKAKQNPRLLAISESSDLRMIANFGQGVLLCLFDLCVFPGTGYEHAGMVPFRALW